jgi:uncharacterized protein (TIGR01777 family)
MVENLTGENIAKGLSVLITGGSGLVGRYLTSVLLSEGYNVSHLSRNANHFGRVRVYRWDPEKGVIDNSALEGIDYIIHLAGANIGEKRWSKVRKEEIVRSRIESAGLLYKAVNQNGKKIKAFISASAIGYYGSFTSEHIFTETDAPEKDFLGTTCKMWEDAADKFGINGTRVVKIRTGVVMEKTDSALAKLLIPARLGVFPRLGNGRQYMPWIHIKDLCGIYLKAVKDESLEGAYNAVAPQHITQTEFMRSLAMALNKNFFHPPVPAIILRASLGEMSDVVLKGSRISSEKTERAGYDFQFRNLPVALENVLLE